MNASHLRHARGAEFASGLRRITNLPMAVKQLRVPVISIVLLSLIVPMSLYAIGRKSTRLTRLTTVEAERHTFLDGIKAA